MAITDLGDLSPHTWFKADAGVLEAISGSDAAEDGDTVERWEDQSGNGRHADQATSSKRPIYHTNVLNGLPGVIADGVDDWLTTAGFTSVAAPYTYVVVCRANYTGVNRHVLTGGGTTRVRTNAGNWELAAGATITDGPPDTDPAIIIGVVNGASSKLRVNGDEDTGNAGTNAAAALNLFSNSVGTNQFWNDYIFEVGFFDYELTSTNITDAEAHLNSKWFPPPVAPLPRVYGRVARQRAAVM